MLGQGNFSIYKLPNSPDYFISNLGDLLSKPLQSEKDQNIFMNKNFSWHFRSEVFHQGPTSMIQLTDFTISKEVLSHTATFLRKFKKIIIHSKYPKDIEEIMERPKMKITESMINAKYDYEFENSIIPNKLVAD